MASCPHCRRPIARIQPRCLYCGKPIPPELLVEAEASAAAALAAEPSRPSQAPPAGADVVPAPGETSRSLLILDLRDADAKRVATALGVSLFEANQRVKRGGFQLHRIADDARAAQEGDAIAAGGVRVLRIPEAETQAADPVLILGGRFEPGIARLRGPGGPLRLDAPDLLLAVRGPIVREYQTPQEWRRLRSASLTQGYRFHLHRSSDPRPVELDPESFEFDERATASSLLRISAWVDAAGVPIDDGFRMLPPALGEADPDARAGIDASAALGARVADTERKGTKTILDNVRQFRAYSAWRGRVERLERGASR